jgi:hypothetical protein
VSLTFAADETRRCNFATGAFANLNWNDLQASAEQAGRLLAASGACEATVSSQVPGIRWTPIVFGWDVRIALAGRADGCIQVTATPDTLALGIGGILASVDLCYSDRELIPAGNVDLTSPEAWAN